MSEAATPAGAFRRLAALFYDSLLLVAVLFLGTIALLPFSGGEAIIPQSQGLMAYAYRAWIALLTLGFFGYSWTRGGQTLGMMSWKIRLQRDDGRLLNWRSAILRLLLGGAIVLGAIIGLWWLRAAPGSARFLGGIALLVPVAANYVWMIFDRNNRTLMDRLCACRVVRAEQAR